MNRRRAYRLSWFRRVSVLIGYSGIPAVPAALRRAPDDPGDAFYDQPDKMEALQPPGGRVRSHADQLGLRLHPRHEPGLITSDEHGQVVVKANPDRSKSCEWLAPGPVPKVQVVR